MAYPTGILSLTLEDIDKRIINVKAYCQRISNSMELNSTPSTTIFDLFIRLRSDRQALASLAETPGLAKYAQAQKNNEGFDIAAEFLNLLSVIDNVTTKIAAIFPRDGDGFLLAQTWGDNGPVDRRFTPEETVDVRNLLAAIISSIS